MYCDSLPAPIAEAAHHEMGMVVTFMQTSVELLAGWLFVSMFELGVVLMFKPLFKRKVLQGSFISKL